MAEYEDKLKLAVDLAVHWAKTGLRQFSMCKFRSQGTAHFGVMVPLISVVGFFISLRWYRSVPKRSLSFFINGDFACMVPSDLSFTNGSFRSSGTAFGS